MLLDKLKRSAARRGTRRKSLRVTLITDPWAESVPGDDRLDPALAASISAHGILNPLLVQKSEGGTYELICGSRRLAAAKSLGMGTVPCAVIPPVTREEAEAMRLAENLMRHEPDFIEVGRALKSLTAIPGVTLQKAAAYAGLTEQEATGSLRVLALPERILYAIRDSGLTKRHALALLRLSNDEIREAALYEMAYRDMGPEAAERYVNRLLRLRPQDLVPGQRPIYVVKDVRMFLNSVSHGMDMMRGGGIDAECVREDADNCIKLTIRIPQKRVG